MSGLRYWNGSRWVGGGAAQLHKIKEDGGWDNHHESFGLNVLKGIGKVIIHEVLDTEKQDFAKPKIRKIK